ncbi:hypothetical protein EQZ23_15705 [Sphingomonas sp. UV9]|uniref:DNA polymerase domain-containing protein n=1 Tax=Sphingomonas sp. UV9 TaxID=1851410 RepID=UPI000FFC01DE|nr:DNA polymerase domain-containing protein [Sphingomonas sp. UV9]RXD03754.1 hypothetical protein EQZ23_15705 [Sphingomonas sp. UV9]
MSGFPIPPVTDELAVALRAYAVPTFRVLPDEVGARPKTPRKASVTPSSGRVLIFDTETGTDAAQSLRFGAYQYRSGDTLEESGAFYDPEGVTSDELATLRAYAYANGLTLRTREEFVDEVFFAQAYQHRATIVGFNLPFDISRLAIRHGTARVPLDSETATMRGAFTFALSCQKIYPTVRIKHMSQKAASMSFAAPMRQPDGRGQRNRGVRTGIRRGHFVDVKTLANAIFARGFSLSSLSRFLVVPNPKLDFDEFAGPVTEDMIHYAVRDVQATWECYAELIDRFDKLNLTRTIPEKVYSEASIGKGYIREMGIVPWRKSQPEVPSNVIAQIMASYYGGRSEVRIRREIRQVMLCDFLSMYPTVCTLMGLWRFVIAEGMTWRDTSDETRSFLDRIDLDALQSQETWSQMTTLVRVLPDADIFPVRAGYEGEPATTIGANYLSAELPLWFTLADCVAAKLLTGKAPKVVEALTFLPGEVQSGLRPINIAGNPLYCVDPLTTDMFKRVIELRQTVKQDMKAAKGDERVRLDTEQHALKICANSTSYGIWVEVNVETRPFRKPMTVHSATCQPYSFKTDKSEMPGTYFHPLLATLITGAARLMLAITERLIADQGLDWSFCDTDSMAIAKPDDMGSDEFARRATTVVDWFASLNPYDFGGSILKIEDVNSSLATGEPEPLYCLAISSKRYALFNYATDGTPIMRKVSAHGLGHLVKPYEEKDAPTDLPVPHDSVLGTGIERWHCDLWHHIVMASLHDTPDQVRLDYHPALLNPAISRYSATSPELLAWFKRYNATRPYRDQVKPFGFLLSMTEAFGFKGECVVAAPRRGRRKKISKMKPIAPFDTDHAIALASAFDRDTGQPVAAAALRIYVSALAQYHLSPESKFLNADYDDRGTTIRRHVRMTETRHIGKESHDWERQAVLGLSLDSEVTYGVLTDDVSEGVRTCVRQFGERMTARALHISAKQLRAVTSVSPARQDIARLQKIALRLPAALRLCEKLSQERQEELSILRIAIDRDGLRETARRLRVDPSNLRRTLVTLCTTSSA